MERRFVLEGGQTVCPLGPLCPEGAGQVAEFTLLLEGVLPERRVAVALWAYELDPGGTEHPRGTRVFTVPAHHGTEATDISLEGIRFLLPPDLDVSGGGPRRLRVRAEAHYVDAGERCLLAP